MSLGVSEGATMQTSLVSTMRPYKYLATEKQVARRSLVDI
jgi:hypothetical protein